MIGCLDLSGDVHSAHLHTLGLVVAAAFSIETMLIRLQSTRLMREALNGSEGSVVLLDDEFHPIWINKAAEKFLGLSINELENADFGRCCPMSIGGSCSSGTKKDSILPMIPGLQLASVFMIAVRSSRRHLMQTGEHSLLT